ENLSAYGVGKHRHTPEIDQVLGYLAGEPVEVIFTPHLVPMDRGIFSTIYVTPRRPIAEKELLEMYHRYFEKMPFVRVRESLPATKDTSHTNFLDVAVRVVNGRIVVLACEDNLVRGASGVAVQNFNRMFGFDQRTGRMWRVHPQRPPSTFPATACRSATRSASSAARPKCFSYPPALGEMSKRPAAS